MLWSVILNNKIVDFIDWVNITNHSLIIKECNNYNRQCILL